MLTIAYYFLQVVLCSGMLMGYYWLVLRNKRFHQYNRFYLLAAALLAWIVPLLKISWNRPLLHSETPQVMNILSAVAANNTQIETTLNQKTFIWNWDLLASGIYLAVASVLLFAMLHAFVKLYRLLKHHSCKNVGDVFLILTQAKGTPFSFFRYIFWNEAIDIRSEAGQQILKHELTHVQQKHSFDKIFIQLTLVAGWFNPFFWMLRREMEMIHEFIADKKAVNNGDTAALAQMLLTAAYPQQKFAMTHPFFFSPIKRRLLMLTNNKNPRFSYIRRLVVLPLLAIVIVLFAFRSKEQRQTGELSVASVVANYKEDIKDVFATNTPQSRPVETILINGRKVPAETINMKDLAYAPYLLGLMDEKHIPSGTNSISYPPIGKAFVADPLIYVNGQRCTMSMLSDIEPSSIKSINVYKNAEAVQLFGPDAVNGVISITLRSYTGLIVGPVIPGENGSFSFPSITAYAKDKFNNFGKNSKVYVSEIIYEGEEKKKVFEETHETRSDEDGKFSVKMGTGTVSFSAKELAQIVDVSKGPFYVSVKTAVAPSVPAASWQPNDNYVEIGSSRLMVKDNTTLLRGTLGVAPNGSIKLTTPDVTVIASNITIADQNDVAKGTATNEPATTQKDNVLNEVTVVGYGSGNNKNENPQAKTPALFPGGNIAWEKYLMRNLNRDVLKKNNAPFGKYTVIVSFIVEKDGGIKEVRAENDPGYGTKAEAERIIIKGPKWSPAKDEKGQPLRYRQKQPIAFVYLNENVSIDAKSVAIEKVSIDAKAVPADKVYIDARTVPREEVSVKAIGTRATVTGGTFSGTLAAVAGSIPPSFPGGLPAWTKYLERNIKKDEPASKGAPPGKYTVIVSFIVDAEGSIKDVRADNDPGYGIKEQGIAVISKGPGWVPATVDGKPIAYRHKISITISVNDSR
jgi:hypothetical protein